MCFGNENVCFTSEICVTMPAAGNLRGLRLRSSSWFLRELAIRAQNDCREAPAGSWEAARWPRSLMDWNRLCNMIELKLPGKFEPEHWKKLKMTKGTDQKDMKHKYTPIKNEHDDSYSSLYPLGRPWLATLRGTSASTTRSAFTRHWAFDNQCPQNLNQNSRKITPTCFQDATQTVLEISWDIWIEWLALTHIPGYK